MAGLTINDVGPRDGLQNQRKILSPEQADQAGLLRASTLAQTLTGTAPGGRSKPWLERHPAKSSAIEAR